MGKVSIVGAGMRSHPGVAAKVFSVLAAEGVNIDMISTSPIKISCVIDRELVAQAVQALHSRVRALRRGHRGRGGAVQGLRRGRRFLSARPDAMRASPRAARGCAASHIFADVWRRM